MTLGEVKRLHPNDRVDVYPVMTAVATRSAWVTDAQGFWVGVYEIEEDLDFDS